MTYLGLLSMTLPTRYVSISSTSEEVRDPRGDSSELENPDFDPLFPLVPLPKKCVTLASDLIGTARQLEAMFPLVPLPKKCVTSQHIILT